MAAPPLLDGLTVVELGDGIAGSAAAATLASLGARVHKEIADRRPHAAHRPTLGGGGVSAIVETLDRLKTFVGVEEAEGLAAQAEVLIVDAIDRPRPLDLVAPVQVTITPFGRTGPRSSEPGGELVAAAAGGLLGTIEPEGGGRPVSPPGFVALRAVGAVAALAALHGVDQHRQRGTSVSVDVSAQEAVVFTAALPECAHVIYDCPGRAGSGRYVAPSGVFPCRDGLIRITAVENHQWQGLVKLLGAPAWTSGLEERPARAAEAEMIAARVGEWTAGQDKAACAALLQEHGVPATAVNLPGELLASPQLAHRGSIEQVSLADEGASVLGPPWRLQLAAPAVVRPALVRDLRVVELTHVLAGPIVGALLGAMGAGVVRIEDLDRLDIYRRTGPFAAGVAGEERGAYFAVANHSKASVAAEGAELVEVTRQLVGRCDVLIENVGQSRLDRLALDLGQTARAGVLALRLSGFGSDGPLSRYRAYANNVQAYGGLAWMTRDQDGELARFGSVLADPLSSVIGATVIAAWALGPERARGGVVDLAMIEVVAGCIAEHVAAASTGVVADPPTGNDLHPYAPHGVYRTADDRWIAIAVQDDEEWVALADALGHPPAFDQDRWRTAAERFDDRRALDEVLEGVVGEHPATDLERLLTGAGVRSAIVATGADLVRDPHLAARRFFPAIDHPELDDARIVGLPWRFDGEGAIDLVGAPSLGSTAPADAVGGRA